MTKILRPDKWLFICSANISRSPTAEYLARKAGLIARSCGTGGRGNMHERYTVTPMTQEAIEWADAIVCMKEGHRLALEKLARRVDTSKKKIFVWALDDDWAEAYHPDMIAVMEPKLLETIQQYDAWVKEKAGRATDDAPQLG